MAFSLLAATANAGPDAGLCHMVHGRAAIPGNFGTDACFDGSHLVLRNQLALVLSASKSGDVGNPKRQEGDLGLAADAERLHSHDPGILLPGDKLTYPVGSGAGTVKIRGSQDNGFYAIATTIADFFPGKPAAWVNAFTGLVAELNDDYAKYQKCIVGKNWIGQLGCDAIRTRDVNFAVARAGVTGFSRPLIQAILAPVTWGKWFDATVRDSKASLSQSGLIRISAAPDNQASSRPASPAKPKPTPSIPTAPPSDSLSIGASFASWCVVAWPTAPVTSSEGIQMTMSCDAVPENEYLFTVVLYGDPDLPVSPEHARAYVEGTISDVAESKYGYRELVVQARSVEVE
jgi:hypothetical protein